MGTIALRDDAAGSGREHSPVSGAVAWGRGPASVQAGFRDADAAALADSIGEADRGPALQAQKKYISSRERLHFLPISARHVYIRPQQCD